MRGVGVKPLTQASIAKSTWGEPSKVQLLCSFFGFRRVEFKGLCHDGLLLAKKNKCFYLSGGGAWSCGQTLLLDEA